MSSWKSSQRLLVGAAIAASLGLAGCADNPKSYPELPPADLGEENYNLWQLLQGAQQFDAALGILEENGLRPTLESADPTTVIAFTNDAFGRLPQTEPPEGSDEEPTTDLTRLNTANLANFSIIPGGARRTAELVAAGTVPSQLGASWVFAPLGAAPTAGYVANGVAQLFGQDACASNGCAFGVDGVVFPDNVFPGTLLDVINAYPLFAPLQAAVAQYDEPIEAEIKAAEEAGDTAKVAALEATLLSTLLETDNGGAGFTLLAPRANGWGNLVNGDGDVTLGREDFAELTEEQQVEFRAQLREFVLYHVLPGRIDESTIRGAATLQTAATTGTTTIAVAPAGSDVTLNADADPETADPRITWFGLTADNGLVHVVSRVLARP